MAKYVDIASVCTIIGNLLGIPYDFDRPITMDDVNESIDEIKSLPTADVIEREKIDKVIEAANDYISTTFKLGLNERAFGMREILEVFMKNIGGNND